MLKAGRMVRVEGMIDQFYDIRHVLAFGTNTPLGQQIEAEIYESYPDRFRENALRALREKRVPRNWFLHNAVGLSHYEVLILQSYERLHRISLLDASLLACLLGRMKDRSFV
jgi:hypothetical protein